MPLNRINALIRTGAGFLFVSAGIIAIAGPCGEQRPIVDGLGWGAIATGAFIWLHLWLNALMLDAEAAPAPDRWRPRPAGADENGTGTPAPSDPFAGYRDIVKQYVAVAGLALALLGAGLRGSTAPLDRLGVSAAGAALLLAVAIGLILLELLTGAWDSDRSRFVIVTLYNLLTWSLLFGLTSIMITMLYGGS